MENCNSIVSIHEGMGTTQNDRAKPALQPEFFLLDERNEQDFILFVQKLSEYVKFYNEFDMADGNWSIFFQRESTSILIVIANWNIELLQNSFEIKKNEILLNNDFISQQNILLDYFTQIRNEFEKLVIKVNYLDDEITEKENLLSSTYLITDKFTQIVDQINNSTDITALLKNYTFNKIAQQLFGLLLSWKNFSKNAIEYQLNSYSKHTPHYALFLSFLKLLDIAKEKLNEFTKKHLDFYYKDVLRIENQNAIPDFVHLVVEPFGTIPFLIPKDTIFLAGKNSIGQKKFYASTTDQAVNAIKLHSFLSSHRNKGSYFKADVLLLNAKNKGFDTFTSDKQEFKEGIMIASPILYLQSGERYIYLRFNDKNYNSSDFDFYITGEEKTIEIVDKVNSNLITTEYIQLKIPATEKKIIPFDEKIHTDFLIHTEFPVLKIIPKNSSVITNISKIEINITVKKFKSFVLDSDFGKIDTEKSFYPFGEFPKNTNGIILSSNEFFMKKNAVASIAIHSILNSTSNQILIADNISILNNQNITENITNVSRSKSESKTSEPNEMSAIANGLQVETDSIVSQSINRLITGSQLEIEEMVNIFQLENGSWKEYSDSLASVQNNYPLQEYNFDEIASQNILSNGKIRIELNNTQYEGEKYMQNYIDAADPDTSIAFPYKPRAKEFIFNYSVSETINLNSRNKENNLIELYHTLPFGFAKLNNGNFYFSKSDSLAGAIYLGFKNVKTNDGLNFLIQLEEGTANPQLEPATISWKYLNNNIWSDLNSNAIGDETYSLTQSGLVNVTIPEFNSSSNTKLEAGLFWLQISVSNIEATCKFIGIHTQALKAVLTDYENSGAVFLENTPKETINKVYKSINSVKKIVQPYASFNGKVSEPDTLLYTRSSERLRHKNRAITTWDYERIILQEFPDVFRIKTLNHYRYDTTISNVSAGYVTLIPIAKSSNSDIINRKPLLSLNKMLLIKEHLLKIASPHARINVKAPRIEKVKVQFKVKFHLLEGMDSRLYITELINTINAYLSPWAYETSEINFANKIEFSSIIQLIDNQIYVDYITDFKVTQYVLNANNEIVGSPIQNLNKIEPQTNFTLFIPNESHLIIAL